MKSNFLTRGRIIFFCIAVFAFALMGKLFLLQVVKGDTYSERADRQYATPSSNIFERGTIYFSGKNGLVSAAMQNTGYKIAINPEKLSDKEKVYGRLSKIIPLDRAEFMAKADKQNDPYEEIADRLTKDQADRISALNIPNVSIFKEKWRFYPGGSLASQTLGFVAYKGDDLAGRYGLERQYEDSLSRNKDSPYVNFFAEVFSNINDTFLKSGDQEGDIVTSIDPSVQSFLEKTLSDVKEKYQVDSIGGIIMNPMDGSIYALASKPDFDPNNFEKVKNPSVFANPLVENVLEFGSVVKPLVMAAGIDTGVVTTDTTYNDKGFEIVGDKQIYNFDKRGRGVVNMQEVLSQSLNTGMVFVYRKLGKENLRNYMLSYGIKDKTGVDLPNETSGLVSNILTSPRDIEYANAAFGQGIALTPMEMIRALASIANGGYLVVPHIAKKIKYNTGLEKNITYDTKPVKFTKATAEEITRMLVNVMDKRVEGGKAKLDHYSVAVKTGTAQVANNANGGYYENRYTHSFFGYFPAYDPKFIIFLYAVNPKGVPYAVQTWADPFMSIVKFLISYYEVPPDR